MAKQVNEFLSENTELVLELKRQLEEKDRVLKNYKKDHGGLEIFFNMLLASVSAIKPKPINYTPNPTKSGSRVEAVMQISDGHMGAVQKPSEVEGFNEFSPDLCRSRQIDFVTRFCKNIDRQRLSYDIDKCNILVTGDLISGDIHQELQVTNAFPVTVQVVEAAKVLAEQLSIVCQDFSEVVVHFIGADNHGRLTKKPQSSDEGINSFNYLVGILAQAYTKKFPNLEFNIYPMHEKVVTCLNRNYLIAHGHGIAGWMGHGSYGILRKIGLEAQARLQIIMDERSKLNEIGFHKYIIGHWHQPLDAVNYSIAGSVQGTTAYDHKNARHAYPSQPGWLIHEKYKEFSRVDYEL